MGSKGIAIPTIPRERKKEPATLHSNLEILPRLIGVSGESLSDRSDDASAMIPFEVVNRWDEIIRISRHESETCPGLSRGAWHRDAI